MKHKAFLLLAVATLVVITVLAANQPSVVSSIQKASGGCDSCNARHRAFEDLLATRVQPGALPDGQSAETAMLPMPLGPAGLTDFLYQAK